MYLCPEADAEFSATLEIKRSKFLAFLTRAQDEEHARDYIASIKSRFPDARHHCSAFICHQDGLTAIERSSDDGEPSGTAGQPMLDVLRGSGMEDVVCVVVRYFGGIKLGAGGLVHAYSEATSLGIAAVRTVARKQVDLYSVGLDHTQAGQVEARLRASGVTVVDAEYARGVTLTLGVAPGQRAELEAQLAALTSGGAVLREAGHTWVEEPSPTMDA